MASLLISIAVIVLGVYLFFGLLLYFMQPTLLYYPVREVSYTPAELGLAFDQVTFKSADGVKLSGWYIPGKSSDFTVLFCHGNGGNMMHCLDIINFLHNFGLNCFIFDYRGYGGSEGKASKEGTYLDAKAAYKWLTEEKKISADNIIVSGWSLGASIAAHLAEKVKVGGLVVESAFTSYIEMGRKYYPYLPVRWFARFNYSTIDYIKDVHCPVMIIHSRDDEIIPFEFGLQLYEAANEPKEFVETFGGHNDGFFTSNGIYNKAWAKWLKFLREDRRKTSHQQAF